MSSSSDALYGSVILHHTDQLLSDIMMVRIHLFLTHKFPEWVGCVCGCRCVCLWFNFVNYPVLCANPTWEPLGGILQQLIGDRNQWTQGLKLLLGPHVKEGLFGALGLDPQGRDLFRVLGPLWKMGSNSFFYSDTRFNLRQLPLHCGCLQLRP